MDWGIPQSGQLVVQAQQGDREPSHLQARDVVADQRAPDGNALALEDAADAVEGDVQLDQRSPAHSVDEREDGVAVFQSKIADDRLEQHLVNLVDRSERNAAPARLAMDANADLHLVIAEVERRRSSGWHDAA